MPVQAKHTRILNLAKFCPNTPVWKKKDRLYRPTQNWIRRQEGIPEHFCHSKQYPNSSPFFGWFVLKTTILLYLLKLKNKNISERLYQPRMRYDVVMEAVISVTPWHCSAYYDWMIVPLWGLDPSICKQDQANSCSKLKLAEKSLNLSPSTVVIMCK